MRISDTESPSPAPRALEVEFEAWLSPEGVLEIPPEVSETLRPLRGASLRIRLRTRAAAMGLQARGVTDEEIATIAALQSEEPEAVVRCLLSEGALRRAPGRGSR